MAKEYAKFTIVAFRQGSGPVQVSVTNTDEKTTRKSTEDAMEGFTFLGFQEFSGEKFRDLIQNQPRRGVIQAEQLGPVLNEIAEAAFKLAQEVQTAP